MSKKNSSVPAKIETPESNQGLSVAKTESNIQLSQNDFNAVFSKEVERVSVEREYFSPEGTEGEVIRAVLTGIGEMKSTIGQNAGSMIPAVEFQSDFSGEVKNYIYGGSKLVGVAASLKKFPAAVEIIYKGKAKAKNSAFKYDDFSVNLLGYIAK